MVRSAPATLAPQDGGLIGSIARLQRLFDVFDRSGIRWSLLRPPAMLAQPEGDIDLLVDPASKEAARTAILDEGFVPIPIASEDLHAVAYDLDSDRFLWLHVQTELRLGGDVCRRVPCSRRRRAIRSHGPLIRGYSGSWSCTTCLTTAPFPSATAWS